MRVVVGSWMLKVYIHGKCSTCRRAVDWLATAGIPHKTVDIREEPPAPDELRTALRTSGKALTSVANTSGMDYRAQGLKEKLPAMAEDQALELLSANGMLVRRPFAIDPGKGIALAGFSEKTWAAKFH